MSIYFYIQETRDVCMPLCIFSSIAHYIEIGTELVHLMIKILPIKRTNNFSKSIESNRIFLSRPPINKMGEINCLIEKILDLNIMDLKNIYFENNPITKIEGLDNLINLQTLNLHNNQLSERNAKPKLPKLINYRCNLIGEKNNLFIESISIE